MEGYNVPPGMYRTKWKGGMDSGRHNAHDWMDGPQPVGVTNAICIFDALLLEGALIVCHFCHLIVSKFHLILLQLHHILGHRNCNGGNRHPIQTWLPEF